MLGKILALIVCIAIGMLLMIKNREMVRLWGRVPWAERKLGPGGSETLWKIVGIVVIIIGVFTVTGDWMFFVNILRSIFNPGA